MYWINQMLEPKKPWPPSRKTICRLYDEATLSELREMVDAEHQANNISAEAAGKAKIVLVKGRYGDDDSVEIQAVGKKDEEKYAKDLAKYEIKKAEYDVWWAENKGSIMEIRKSRAALEKKAQIAALEKQIERLKNG